MYRTIGPTNWILPINSVLEMDIKSICGRGKLQPLIVRPYRPWVRIFEINDVKMEKIEKFIWEGWYWRNELHPWNEGCLFGKREREGRVMLFSSALKVRMKINLRKYVLSKLSAPWKRDSSMKGDPPTSIPHYIHVSLPRGVVALVLTSCSSSLVQDTPSLLYI